MRVHTTPLQSDCINLLSLFRTNLVDIVAVCMSLYPLLTLERFLLRSRGNEYTLDS
jgi:hypothetical protein